MQEDPITIFNKKFKNMNKIKFRFHKLDEQKQEKQINSKKDLNKIVEKYLNSSKTKSEYKKLIRREMRKK